MKKLTTLVFLIVCIFAAAGCGRTYSVSSVGTGINANGFVTALENGVVSYNVVEFVFEGTDRAKELGIENTDNGYVIYDSNAEIETAEVATNVEFYLQRWIEAENTFGPVAVSAEEFQLELENRSPDGILCTLALGYDHIESGQRQIVSGLTECYVP